MSSPGRPGSICWLLVGGWASFPLDPPRACFSTKDETKPTINFGAWRRSPAWATMETITESALRPARPAYLDVRRPGGRTEMPALVEAEMIMRTAISSPGGNKLN